MAFFWPLLRSDFFGITTLPGFYDAFPAFAPCVALPVSGLLACLLLLACKRFARALLSRKALLLALVFAGAAGEWMLSLFGQGGALDALCCVVGSACVAANFAFLVLAWGEAFSSSADRHAPTLAAASFCLSFAVSFLVGFLPIDVFAKNSVCSLASGAVWLVFSGASLANATPKSTTRKPAAVSLALVVILALFLIVGSVMRGFCLLHNIGQVADTAIFTAKSLSPVAALLLLFFVHRFQHNKNAQNILMLVLLFVCMSTVFFAAFAFSQTASLSSSLIVSGRFFLAFYFWLFLLYLVRDNECPVWIASLTFVCVEAISWLLSYAVVPLAARTFVHSGGYSIESIALAMVFFLVAGVFVLLCLFLLKKQEISVAQAPDASEEEFWAATKRQYGLTDREVEVMQLFAQGHSVKRVAELLVISPATVQAHNKNLYRKLDIHSKQQLIDYVRAHRP